MQIAFHLGAPATDDERLLRALLQNRDTLARYGVEVPAPGRYRDVLREAAASLKGGVASETLQEAMLDAIVDRDDVRRVVFSNPTFLGMPGYSFSTSGMFPRAAMRATGLFNLFPSADIEFHLAICHPGIFLQRVAARVKDRTIPQMVNGVELNHLRWAPAVRALTQAVPHARVVVWCNEDAPFVWPEVMRRVSGVPAAEPMEGDLLMIQRAMRPEGAVALDLALTRRTPQTVQARRAIFAEMLHRFANPEITEETIDLPGWTDVTLDLVDEIYDSDAAEIAATPGVEFIAP
ncbi:hypothetical protein [Paracoccus pacificus]|uniref:ABC transporter substrate-binding protein n=1 Tax=Paracoccus pacificus TaxID=1463598 RepID=A0ABW4RBC0_9RHOB